MKLRGRQLIEPKIFRKWWKNTTNNATAERSDEIFKMVKNLTWVRMVADREFDPRGLDGEINKGLMVKGKHSDPEYQYYYWANDGRDKVYLLWPTVPTRDYIHHLDRGPNVGNDRWSLQSYGSASGDTGWSLGINPPSAPNFYVAINKQQHP